MTACVNRKHSKKVAAVVTASLVGALSLGIAPVAAMATDGIDMQALDPEPMANGEVEYKGGDMVADFAYNGHPQGPVPVKVKPYNEDIERVNGILPKDADDRIEGNYYYYYVKVDDTNVDAPAGVSIKNDKGQTVALTGKQVRDAGNNPIKPTDAGTYAVVVGQIVNKSGTIGNYIGLADTFTITGQELDLAQLCDGLDATDSTFNYTGKNDSTKVSEVLDRINVQMNGRILDKKDYKISLWDQGGKTQLTDSTPDISDVISSGQIYIDSKYIVKIEGLNDYSGQVIEREFTLGKLDLSSAEVTGSTILTGNPRPSHATTFGEAVTSINGVALADLNQVGLHVGSGLSLEYECNPDGSSIAEDPVLGGYTFKLVADTSNPHVTGEATFTVWYANYAAQIDYTGKATPISGENDAYVVDLSDPKSREFDVRDIDIYYNWSNRPGNRGHDVDSDGYKIVVTNAEEEEVTDLTTPGTYTVRVDVDWKDPANDNRLVAGSKTFKVVVQYAVDMDTDVFFSYKGQNVPVGTHDEYDGSDFTENMSIKVKVDTGELAEGEDYEVLFEKVNGDGSVETVDQIVDAGYYNVVVRGITFSGDYIFDFEVTPVKIKVAEIDTPYTVGTANTPALAWTGEVLTPSFKWDADGDGEAEAVIPADLYDVEYTSDIDGDGVAETVELKDKGDYVAHLTTKDGVVNYEVDADVEFAVSDAKVYSDVPGSYWAAENIYNAGKLEYMKGYNGTTFFGPLDNIKRGDVAQVLYNMAGQPKFNDEDFKDETGNFETGFADQVDGMYYNQAIAWAKSVGIVSGDTGTNMFRAEDTISRQELAKMLCVYAEKTGHDVDVDADAVLAEYEDAGTVSDWAKDYVAWAVEADLMGQDSPLRGTDPINRAEVATMAVRLQPEKLEDSEDLFN